jgi:hypothetical protein
MAKKKAKEGEAQTECSFYALLWPRLLMPKIDLAGERA